MQSDDAPIRTLYIDEGVAESQLARLDRVKRTRDQRRVRLALDRLRAGAGTTDDRE